MRAFERVILKMRGIDPNELESEFKEMDEAKARRERERREAERKAQLAAQLAADRASVEAMRRRV